MRETKDIVILIAEDDEDDRLLTLTALEMARLANDVRFVENGVELLQYLRREGPYADPASSPTPGIILLDLNMPRMDGQTALGLLKRDPELRRLPVVVLTTSEAHRDILASYDLGANSFITKPVTFEGLVEVVRGLGTYWFSIVELPEDER